MKKSLNLVSAAVLLLLATSLTGCSSEYQSERYLYRATRLSKDTLLTPEAVPPQEFDRAVSAYKLVFERYPDTWAARRARMGLGSLYLARKEYVKAREIFTGVLAAYPDNKDIRLEAQFAIGKSYEDEGRWEEALSEYQKLIRDYPNTEPALDLLMYIARHYEKQGNIATRDKAYNSAIMHYRKAAKDYPNTMLGFKAENLIAMSYIKKEDWAEAVNALAKLVMDYPTARNVGLSMRLVMDISVQKLKSPERAREILEAFLEKYPGHPMEENLKKGLEALSNVSTGQQQQ